MVKEGYVLVAEPERALAATIARIVASVTSLPVRIVTDGNDGHNVLAAQGPPEILVTELTLPKRDGFSLVRGLRRADPARRARVVALSSFPAVRRECEALRGELAPIEILPKPLVHADLERALRAKPTTPAASPPISVRRSAAPAVAEPARIARIEASGVIDDAPPDATMQKFVSDIAAEFNVPTALVTIVLESKQWFKSFVGIDGDMLAQRGTPRAWSFCQHVVDGRHALVVPDARVHPTFAKTHLVETGKVVGYAGAPVVTPEGDVLGALCIVDTKPIDIDASAVHRLRLAARRIAGEIQLEAARRRRAAGVKTISSLPPEAIGPTSRAASLRTIVNVVDALPCPAIVFDEHRVAIAANVQLAVALRGRVDALVGQTRDALVQRLAALFAEPEEAMDRLVAPPTGAFVIAEDFDLASGGKARWTTSPIELPGGTFVSLTTIVSGAAL